MPNRTVEWTAGTRLFHFTPPSSPPLTFALATIPSLQIYESRKMQMRDTNRRSRDGVRKTKHFSHSRRKGLDVFVPSLSSDARNPDESVLGDAHGCRDDCISVSTATNSSAVHGPLRQANKSLHWARYAVSGWFCPTGPTPVSFALNFIMRLCTCQKTMQAESADTC